MIIKDKFSRKQIELLNKSKIDIEKDYSDDELEELEDEVYNLMMDNLDENQDFTLLAEEYEKILDIIATL